MNGSSTRLHHYFEGCLDQFVLQQSILSGSFQQLAMERIFHLDFGFSSSIIYLVLFWICFSHFLLIAHLISLLCLSMHA